MNSNGKKIIIRRACKIGVCKCMNFILRGGGWRRMSITTLHSGHPFFKIPPPLFFIYLFIYLFNFIYTRVKTSGLKGNTKITLIILSKYLSTTKLNLMTVKNKNNNKIKCLLSMNAV